MTIVEQKERAKADYYKSYKAGQKSEYDKFWDVFQSQGALTSYNYAFAYGKWNDYTFRPKYDICPTGANFMFAYNNNIGTGTDSKNHISDLSACLKNANIVFDTSNATNTDHLYYQGTGFTHLPATSFEGCTEIKAVFYGCNNLHTIDKLIFKSDGTNTFSANSWDVPFGGCIKLQNITEIVGVIGDSINLKDAPLTKESIVNVLNALSSTVTGKTLTLNKTAKEAAFTDSEWQKITAQKANWEIQLL